MLPPRITRVLGAALALATLACNGPGTKAYSSNIPRTYSLFAVTGSPATTPSGIAFLSGSVVADASFSFDVAFDIDGAGATRLYPVRLLAGTLAGPRKRIGLQKVTGGFEALTEAPTTGYDTLTAQLVTPGSVLAVEVQDVATCQYTLNGNLMYAKLVVDSIRVGERRVFGRTVTDPNCGFKQLMPDTIPTR